MRDRLIACLALLTAVIPTLSSPTAAWAGVPPQLITAHAPERVPTGLVADVQAVESHPLQPSLVIEEEVSPAQRDAAVALLSSNHFQFAMPFRTQKDGDRFQGANCGPASLGMVLQAFGIDQSTQDLRYRSQLYQGTWGLRVGTALQHMASVAKDLDLQPMGLYDGADFHRWSIDDIRHELESGRPVIPLVKYRLLPGHETSTTRFDHYIVIYGMDGDRFLYHDPIFADPSEGAARWIAATQLESAMRIALVPYQAVSFDPGNFAPLAVSPLGVLQA